MPYTIRKEGKVYKVFNRETGALKGTHPTKAKAEAQVRLLQGIAHGMVPRKRRKGK